MIKRVAVLALLLALFLSACANQSNSAAPATQPVKKFVGSINSDKYHRPNCEWAKKIRPDNAVWFSSPEEAKNTGYKPCKACRPLG